MQRAAGLHDCLLNISRHGAIEIAVEVLQVAQIAQPTESFRSRYPNRIQYSRAILRRLALLKGVVQAQKSIHLLMGLHDGTGRE